MFLMTMDMPIKKTMRAMRPVDKFENPGLSIGNLPHQNKDEEKANIYKITPTTCQQKIKIKVDSLHQLIAEKLERNMSHCARMALYVAY